MAIFIDSSDLDEIRKYHRMGILRGVTTNPTILVKDGIKKGLAGVEKRAKEIAGLINPLPLSMEVTTNDVDEMIREAKIIGVVGRDGGMTAKLADACVVVPTVDEKLVTALTESFQAVIWHLLISHPDIQKASMKWEGLNER